MKKKIFSILLSLIISVSVAVCFGACSGGYKIIYNTDGNGTIEGESVQRLEAGEQSSGVTAVPNEGYSFVKWSDDSREATRTDIAQSSNLTLTAIFETSKYKVKYTATDGGVIYGASEQTVEYGKSAERVTAGPLLGYRFIKWSDNNSTEYIRTDINITSDISATAIFEKIRTDVQFVYYFTDGNGTIEGQTFQQVVYDKSSSKVTAIPNEGYEFLQWSDGVTTAERQDLNVTEDMTVTAQFKRVFTKYKLNYKYGEADTDISEFTFYDDNFIPVKFPVPTRELFTFGGWYIGDKQVTDTSGKMIIGEELLKSSEKEIYAKWTANENYTYKILMVYVTELDAVIPSVRGNEDFDVYYKMSDFDIEICKTLTVQLSRYLNEMLDGLVAFEVDEYFTTVPVGSESIWILDSHGGAARANLIPEIFNAGLCEEYQSLLTVFCMDDYDYEFHTAAGSATNKYGTIHLETVYGETKINNEPLENILDLNYWRWDKIISTFIHELAHTIEMRIDAYEFHKIMSNYHIELGVDIIEAEKLYFNNQAIIDGCKVGIPVEFWKGEIAKATYLATEGGYTTYNVQEIIYGGNAQSVKAIPHIGYEFVGWSDGVLTATRTDLNLYNDLTVTAIFSKIE